MRSARRRTSSAALASRAQPRDRGSRSVEQRVRLIGHRLAPCPATRATVNSPISSFQSMSTRATHWSGSGGRSASRSSVRSAARTQPSSLVARGCEHARNADERRFHGGDVSSLDERSTDRPFRRPRGSRAAERQTASDALEGEARARHRRGRRPAGRYGPLVPALVHGAARAALAAADGGQLQMEHVVDGIRTVTSDKLSRYASRVVVKQTWSDIVLPEEHADAVEGLLQRVRGRSRVYEDWGFAAKVGRGQGSPHCSPAHRARARRWSQG